LTIQTFSTTPSASAFQSNSILSFYQIISTSGVLQHDNDLSTNDIAPEQFEFCNVLSRAQRLMMKIMLVSSRTILAQQLQRARNKTLREIALSLYLLIIDCFVRNRPNFYAPGYRCPLIRHLVIVVR
jgi:hypothetical protein